MARPQPHPRLRGSGPLIAGGGITTFLSQAAVMRYLGPNSDNMAAYSVASVSGAVLAVCSYSVLPMFAGIYNLGADLGPASAFLYSGPAINVLAIFLTARVLGSQIGLWRAPGAILFAFLVGLGMPSLFRREEREKAAAAAQIPQPSGPSRRMWQSALLLAGMIGFLIFSDWFRAGTPRSHDSRPGMLSVCAACNRTQHWFPAADELFASAGGLTNSRAS